jgi:hypothetical protein
MPISSMHCSPSLRIPGSPPYVSIPKKCKIWHAIPLPKVLQHIAHAVAIILRSGALSGALCSAFWKIVTQRWRVASGVCSRMLIVASRIDACGRTVSLARGIAVQPYRPGVSLLSICIAISGCCTQLMSMSCCKTLPAVIATSAHTHKVFMSTAPIHSGFGDMDHFPHYFQAIKIMLRQTTACSINAYSQFNNSRLVDVLHGTISTPRLIQQDSRSFKHTGT